MENRVLLLADRFVEKFSVVSTLVNHIVDRLVPQESAQAASCPGGQLMCWDECIDVRCSHYDTALRYDCAASWSDCMFGNFRQYSACGAC